MGGSASIPNGVTLGNSEQPRPWEGGRFSLYLAEDGWRSFVILQGRTVRSISFFRMTRWATPPPRLPLVCVFFFFQF